MGSKQKHRKAEANNLGFHLLKVITARLFKGIAEDRRTVTALLAAMKLMQISAKGRASLRQMIEFSCKTLDANLDFTEPEQKPKSVIMVRVSDLKDGVENKAT